MAAWKQSREGRVREEVTRDDSPMDHTLHPIPSRETPPERPITSQAYKLASQLIRTHKASGGILGLRGARPGPVLMVWEKSHRVPRNLLTVFSEPLGSCFHIDHLMSHLCPRRMQKVGHWRC